MDKHYLPDGARRPACGLPYSLELDLLGGVTNRERVTCPKCLEVLDKAKRRADQEDGSDG